MIKQGRIRTLARTLRPLLLAAALVHGGTAAAQGPLVPLPRSIVTAPGAILIQPGEAIAAPDAGARIAAELLVERVSLPLRVADAARIRFVRDPAIAGDEAYRLEVSPAGIRIAASGTRGLIHGAMTLAQLLDDGTGARGPVRLPAMTIDDAPRFAWRGLMLDVARHFQPIGEVRRIIDQMVTVKLNTLHLHLTDDQGWRFEVKRYPRLTEVGGWRIPPSAGGAPGPQTGGFYTQEELKALVAYAAARGVTIVPEIDLPGHANALVSAYPEHGVLGDTPPVGGDWGVNPWLLDPGPEGVAFVKQVIDELITVFPGRYIHLGGDEAVKDQWQRSPAVQRQIKALGLKDETALQAWLMGQFAAYLADNGRRLIGWDEILDGGLPPSATVMSWRGEAGAVAAANSGHDVVLSPAPILYLDNLQSDGGDEPPGRIGVQSLEAVYRYEPMPAGIAAERAGHVLGAQGNAWSEYLVTPHQVQYSLFPRAAAIAEMTWSPKEARDFAGFLPRVQAQMRRWRAGGVAVADSAFAVRFAVRGTSGAALRSGRAVVSLSSQTSYGTIRYTRDGSAPGPRSPAYAGPLAVKPGTVIRAAAFDAAGRPTAADRRFDTSRTALLSRANADLAPCPGGTFALRMPLLPDATANAPAYNINLFDTCSVYPDAPLGLAGGFRIDVARLPYNFGLGNEGAAIRRYYAVTTHGELLVRAGCTAKDARPVIVASFPLPDPATAPQRLSFTGTLAQGMDDQDLCFQFTAPIADSFYTVERVQLTERAR